ncbi:TetR/AcrR family transcriptional regulator [Sporolactobacillus putidus]|uniref:AcrR family transcriptional regulator n=1 Tax=Sporolactobacillus putidus TaxID=492735 RepID=A0A917W3P8_9BACL|nr:TetR/AcrR family transcriptional regulator [Sporolactobacillus putidus]GGL64469.1 AcrR family transcriptional regulator [Sporolactobacillus putidus]
MNPGEGKTMRRNKIINAAEKLFFSKGYERSTMDDIAREAHFSKRTVYAYFNSKEQLHFEVMIRGYRQLIAMLKKEGKKTNDRPADGRLEQMADTFYQFSTDFPDYFAAIFSYENGESDFQKGIPDQSREECYKLGEDIFGMLTGLLREGQEEGIFRNDLDPVKTAIVLWSCMVGVFHTSKVKANYFQNYHHTSSKDLFSGAFQMMIRSIQNEGGGSPE